jgi:hypothetical protein
MERNNKLKEREEREESHNLPWAKDVNIEGYGMHKSNDEYDWLVVGNIDNEIFYLIIWYKLFNCHSLNIMEVKLSSDII